MFDMVNLVSEMHTRNLYHQLLESTPLWQRGSAIYRSVQTDTSVKVGDVVVAPPTSKPCNNFREFLKNRKVL